jgi:NTE family protein
MDITEISTPWYDGLKNGQKSGVDTAASPEAARRYYSVKNLLVNQVRNNMYYVSEDIKDERFFDNFQLCEQRPECNCNWIVYNEWLVHSIYHYGKVSRIMLVFQYRVALEISSLAS